MMTGRKRGRKRELEQDRTGDEGPNPSNSGLKETHVISHAKEKKKDGVRQQGHQTSKEG